ncbi:hypothetical protein DV515_00002602 [Chloebia gouldiae]|uniref:Small integral membrane protein 19 n=1 Tax=Chloebia gouldiae TaxID=44316 RepID=A0A3L8SV62_CHLGU|nr:hypothetical protein DV515_00002602 [Chloebia gouldiae]
MAAAAGAAGAGGGAAAALGDGGAIDYSVHEAWNEATNVYLLVVLASLALLVYARRNKRRILRIFTLPPAAETPPEPNFYDSVKKIRLRQQLEMYSIACGLCIVEEMRNADINLVTIEPFRSSRGSMNSSSSSHQNRLKAYSSQWNEAHSSVGTQDIYPVPILRVNVELFSMLF